MAIVNIAIGVISIQKEYLRLSQITFGVAFVFFILGLAAPKKLSAIHVKWIQFGEKLRLISTPIVLTIFFFIFLTPIALLLKILKKDLLRLDTKSQSSYWISAEEPSSFKDQF